jgi:hypothetical protein
MKRVLPGPFAPGRVPVRGSFARAFRGEPPAGQRQRPSGSGPANAISSNRSKIPTLLQFSFPLQQLQSDTVCGTSYLPLRTFWPIVPALPVVKLPQRRASPRSLFPYFDRIHDLGQVPDCPMAPRCTAHLQRGPRPACISLNGFLTRTVTPASRV